MSYTNRIFNWDLDMLNYFVNKYVLGPLRSMVGYYECATAAATAAKTVTASWFTLRAGGSMKIKMTYANTAASGVTLNINSTGAKSLYYDGAAVSASNTWEAGETIEVYYDGTSYYANNVAGGVGDGVFDLSKHNAVGGVLATYADLSAALTALNALESKYKYGGMSFKFVQSSDNNYVQWRYMGTAVTGNPNPFLDTANWQGVDNKPIAKSRNLVESGGVKNALPTFDIVGQNNTYVQGSYYNGIKAGNKYRVWVKNPNVDMTGVTVGNDSSRFSVIADFADNTTADIVRVNVNSNLAEYYDFVAPENIVSIHTGGRCTEGEVLSFYIEDITLAESLAESVLNNTLVEDADEIADFESSELFISEDIDSNDISILSGYAIDTNGKIITSSISGATATVRYLAVSKGDIICLDYTKTDFRSRLAFGLFTTVENDATALYYKSYPILTANLRTYLSIKQSGYFAFYTLHDVSLKYVKTRVGVNELYPFKYLIGSALYKTTGNTVDVPSRCCTDFLEIGSTAESITYARIGTTNSTTNFASIAFYDDNKVFISAVEERTGVQKGDYDIHNVDIPSGAKYMRFGFYNSIFVGSFWFCYDKRDAIVNEIKNLSINIPDDINATKVSFVGQAEVSARSRDIIVNERRILKIKIEDVTKLYTSGTNSAKLMINAYDSNGVSTTLIRYNKSDIIPSDELYAVTPIGTKYIRIGGRSAAGTVCVFYVEDISNQYPNMEEVAASDIDNYQSNRGLLNFDVKDGVILNIVNKNASTTITHGVNSYTVDSSHSPQGTTIEGDNTKSATFCISSGDYCGIFFKKSSALTNAEILQDYSIQIFRPADDTEKINSVLKLYGSPSLVSDKEASITDFCVKPKEASKFKVNIPSWMRIRFYGGLRTGRDNTQYYYNGDTAELDYSLGGIYVRLSRLDDRIITLDYAENIMQEVLLELLDSNDGSVITRNFDAEKYLGAIEATPNVSPAVSLPTIVHTSDTHGDAVRLSSVHDWADYIGADLIVNTGDNPFYLMGDGVKYNEQIVKEHKTDYANCLGNHDTYDTSGGVAGYTQKNIGVFAETYHYYKGIVNDEPVITDKCYYYKDLADKNLRIIAIDLYDGIVTANYKARVSETQIQWFIDTLANTPAGYGVIVIMHQVPHTLKAISGKTDFNDSTMNKGDVAEDEWQCSGIDSDYMTTAPLTGNPFGKIVDAFIGKTTVSGTYNQKNAAITQNETISYSADFTNLAEGVEFIMYLNGHTHRDFVGYVADCEHNQLNINVCSTSPISQSTGYKSPADIMRDSNGSNQDAYNVYTINRTDKTVGIARIGSNLSKDLRDRKVMFVSYADEV